MSDATVLAEIKRLAGLGRVVLTSHVLDRMAERNVRVVDVFAALLSATAAIYQPDRLNWRVTGGSDMSNDSLTVIVDVESSVVIVTVF